MTRAEATKHLRDTLDAQGLQDWHIRLTTDLTRPFLGMCSYKDRTIILNAHHIDTHPDIEVKNTNYHEVAHALLPMHGHDEMWQAKARELGCDDPTPCSSMTFSPEAIDAIRSGAELKVEFTERIVREAKYTVSRLQDKCPTCGKVAKVIPEKTVEFKSGGKRKIMKWFECGHFIIIDSDSVSDFEEFVFDGSPTCKHEWNKTICSKCNAKRLYKYQIDGARFLERANGRAALFDEQGLGKTIQAIVWMKYNPDKAFKYLWTTKSGIMYQHGKELIRLLGPQFFPQVITSGRATLHLGVQGYIISYDMYRRLPNLDMFVNAGVKTLILDECQAIKNPDSSRTQAIRKVAKNIPSIIPLSGTPWKNRGSEFFVALNLLDPKQFWSFEGFKKRWVEFYEDKQGKRKEGGIVNPKAFRKAIEHIALRRERTEVLPELPLVNRTRLLCEMPEHVRTVYNEELDKLTKKYNEAVIGGTEESFTAKADMIQSLIIMRQIVGIAKVDATVDFASEFLEETDRKLVIFVHHKECGRLIASKMAEWCAANDEPTPLVLNAALSPEERMEVQDKFNGPNYRLLVASTLASGEGLNLQTCCDCVLHERQWNPANEEQAEGRFIRIGQLSQSVNATYVHGDNTIDTTMDGIVEPKRIRYHNVMNKGEMATWNESSLMSELIAALVKNGKR